MKYYNSLCAILSTFMIFFYSFGMEPLIELKKSTKKEGYLETLNQLKEDLKNNKSIYKFGYFEPISQQINKLTVLHKKNPIQTTFFFLIKEYKKQLDIHAKRCIQSIIDNPTFQTLQAKLAALYSYFPQNDLLLKAYFDLGTLKINLAHWKQKEILRRTDINTTEKQQKLSQKIEKTEQQIHVIEEQLQQNITQEPQQHIKEAIIEEPEQEEFIVYEQPQKPKKQPNIFTRTITSIWNGISSAFKWILSFFPFT